VQVHATVLASELRRRRVGARKVMSALEAVNRETYIMGDLRDAPTSLLMLAALSLTSGPEILQA
jgi:protein-L-isoaspartate O-methyltransferase